MNNLTLGILTYNAPKTLKRTLIPKFCIDNTDIETAATSWWTSQQFSVITGDGLFCHDRLDGK